jgi:hypothetical protein
VSEKRQLRKFRVTVLHVPPRYMVELGLDSQEYREVEIEGYTLADAKRKAGIQ